MRPLVHMRNLASFSLLLHLVGACGDDAAPLAGPAVPGTMGADATATGNPVAASGGDPALDTGANANPKGLGLQWKRYRAFEADLSRALELPPDSLCQELGGEACVREVHLVALGGHEPFETGMFEPSQEPLATTPTVVERIVLSACIQRVTIDREAGAAAVVFDEFPLDGPAPAATDATTQALVTDLFHRLLSRDPSPMEIETMTALAADGAGTPLSASDFAALACFSLGTSAEFLLF